MNNNTAPGSKKLFTGFLSTCRPSKNQKLDACIVMYSPDDSAKYLSNFSLRQEVVKQIQLVTSAISTAARGGTTTTVIARLVVQPSLSYQRNHKGVHNVTPKMATRRIHNPKYQWILWFGEYPAQNRSPDLEFSRGKLKATTLNHKIPSPMHVSPQKSEARSSFHLLHGNESSLPRRMDRLRLYFHLDTK